jgi:hypothetical protein
MIYQIVIVRENKLNSFLSKIQSNLKSLELCPPHSFLPIEETYNLHKYNSNFVFKVNNSSSLAYFICRVSNREQVVLNSIAKEFDANSETIGGLSSSELGSNLFKNIVLAFLFFINLDLLLAVAFYILNYKRFNELEILTKLNIFCFAAALIGLLNYSILGINFDFINQSSFLSFPPNVGYLTNKLEIKALYALLIISFSKLVLNFFFKKPLEVSTSGYKNLTDLKLN